MGLSSSLCLVSFKWLSNLQDFLLSKHLCYTVMLFIASHFRMKRLIKSSFLNVPRLFLYRLKMLTETLFLRSLAILLWNCEKPVKWEEKAHILGCLYISHKRWPSIKDLDPVLFRTGYITIIGCYMTEFLKLHLCHPSSLQCNGSFYTDFKCNELNNDISGFYSASIIRRRLQQIFQLNLKIYECL